MKNTLFLMFVLSSFISKSQNLPSPPCLSADIIFLVDESHSMQGVEAVVADALSVLIEGIQPEEHKIQFAVVSFGKESYIKMRFTSDYEKLKSFTQYYGKVVSGDETTLILPGIDNCVALFQKSTNNKERFKIVIVISDGKIFDEDLVRSVNQISEKENINIYSLGFAPEIIPTDYFSPTMRVNIVTKMNVDEDNLIKISNKGYFGNNIFRLRDKIRELGACL